MNKKTISTIILGIVILVGLAAIGIFLNRPKTTPATGPSAPHQAETSTQTIESMIEKNPELKKVKELGWLQIIPPTCPTCPGTLITIDGEISEISDKTITLVPGTSSHEYSPLPENTSFKIPVSKKAGIVSRVAQGRIEFNKLEKGDLVTINLEVKSDGNYEAMAIIVNAKK